MNWQVKSLTPNKKIRVQVRVSILDASPSKVYKVCLLKGSLHQLSPNGTLLFIADIYQCYRIGLILILLMKLV